MALKIIDESTLEKIKQQILLLYSKTQKMRTRQSIDDWLDNQELCLLLDVSLRTLQTYRDKGVLAYSMIGHKCYYKRSDISTLMEQLKIQPKKL